MLKLARCLPTSNAIVFARPAVTSHHHVLPIAHSANHPAAAALGATGGTALHGGRAAYALGAGVAARSLVSYRNALSVRKATNCHLAPHTPHPADPFNQTSMEVANALNNPPPSIRSVIVRLLQNLSSKKEVDHYLKYYGGFSNDSGANFAVIKIGGGLIMDELDTLVSSLSFLVDVGLLPVVIHGAGPQLNAKLKSRNIVSEYHGGIRVTTPEILQVAKATFQEENFKLLEALENRGVRARGLQGGVFTAEMLDFNKFQYVGEVKSVETKLIKELLSKGVVPVITCMAEAVTGQLLNVNADVAAQQLAKTLQPKKVVYLSQAGGLKDQHGAMISQIDLPAEYDQLMNQDWFTHGNRLKLKEIKTLLDALPLNSSVSITSAEKLPQELMTHKGSGTLVKRTEAIHSYTSLDSVDIERLRALLESSFSGKLMPTFFEDTSKALTGLYLSEQYTSTAIVTALKEMPGVDYLDKFAVDPAAQGTGTAHRLWNILTAKHPRLIWRSRSTNPINPWYSAHATGSFTPPGSSWTVFFYGLTDLAEAARGVEVVLSKKASVDREAGKTGKATMNGEKRGFTSWTNVSMNSSGTRAFSTLVKARGRRSFTTSSAAAAAKKQQKTRVGLVGARGYTGGELMSLLSRHPNFTLVSANSRALIGQPLCETVPQLKHSTVDWAALKFGNLTPQEMAESSDVDLWVLALPNGVAKPYVEALTSAGSKSQAKLLDLSADYRFNSDWTYGLPEAKGRREQIRQAKKVANPGCYATAMQLALLPLASLLSPSHAPSCFGVSGYSGAGTTPSRKNDLAELKDNLMPYSLQGHIHEREVLAQLKSNPISPAQIDALNFVPHVAPWFSGIQMTVTATLSKPMEEETLRGVFREYFAGEPQVKILPAGAIPEVAHAAGKHGASVSIHSAASHPGRVVICVTLDNLLKGAATQAVQNMNLLAGYEEFTAVPL